MYANDNSKFTQFLIKNKEAFEHYFKQTKYNQDIEKLYTLQDVYDQITVIVDSVSYLKGDICNSYIATYVCIVANLKKCYHHIFCWYCDLTKIKCTEYFYH